MEEKKWRGERYIAKKQKKRGKEICFSSWCYISVLKQERARVFSLCEVCVCVCVCVTDRPIFPLCQTNTD